VIATVALFAAVGTGRAYAANTIGGADVVDESLTDADIKNGSLGAAIADWSIGAFKLAGNAVWGGQNGTLLDNSVSGYDVADDNLTDADVKDGSLSAAIAHRQRQARDCRCSAQRHRRRRGQGRLRRPRRRQHHRRP
jgi:hypothetical protein